MEGDTPTGPVVVGTYSPLSSIHEKGEMKRKGKLKIIKVRRVSSENKKIHRSIELLESDYIYISPLDSSFWVFFLGLVVITFASIVTRMYKISEPNHVA